MLADGGLLLTAEGDLVPSAIIVGAIRAGIAVEGDDAR